MPVYSIFDFLQNIHVLKSSVGIDVNATNKLRFANLIQTKTGSKTVYHFLYILDRRIRERTVEKLWRKNSGAMELFIMTLEVNNF